MPLSVRVNWSSWRLEVVRSWSITFFPCCLWSDLASFLRLPIFAGKSLCYQLPAVVLGGTSIVISPLIALMQDQVQALNDKGVAAALISSGNGDRHNREIMERLLGRSLAARPQKVKPADQKPFDHITILYVTPEQVQTTRFRDILVELHKKNSLSLFAVDEAHW